VHVTDCESGVLSTLLTGISEVPRETSTDISDDPFSRFISLRNSTRKDPDCVHSTSLAGQFVTLLAGRFNNTEASVKKSAEIVGVCGKIILLENLLHFCYNTVVQWHSRCIIV